jgi:hypothetical protein
MEITSYTSVLTALEHRANRYTNQGRLTGVDDSLMAWALDETGTVNTSLLCKNYEQSE